MEKTFVMIKPDGIQRELVGDIIQRIENKGMSMVAMKLMSIPKELCEKHYECHKEKPFYGELVKFMTSGPVLAMVLEGRDVIRIMRKIAGATSPKEALPGTIRGDFAADVEHNLIHTSDSEENAEREINLFFKKEEIINYSLTNKKWIYSNDHID
ncbi:MAG: nucleoside-diphosphate kinase [Leptotrichiaceae bacterium]|nr:nucleoside-diphosphate kinase [Leptotrichiaceae bacterium]MBP6167435.1 nucleoside-diphosphate kinase [Leptotrichiaceae bacterium]MBP7026187.1 nucleoside-diphosphate kinase [Leptotrichiaceae bacterium]MBP8636783.1 nucleoside-diphosphate kinase [Leptotrichiaceae bacterium]MBP9538918.1 nucleoside-diphosphate kinase [Leptotrichiaceae bacterium]